ncbi:MAG: CRISPR-associated protein Cas4 [Oleiphilus sp.]|nr:MAG: CRISPR-associated protein Cas4 [Oleiphilus sp.]
MEDLKAIPLSALQHYAFCPRQCALIHNEQLWAENWHTAKGNVLHERVDEGLPETRNGIRFERSVQVHAPKLRLVGTLDLLEVNLKTGELTPVEYKKGKSKADNWDRIQLCAQAMCLEEMRSVKIVKGAIWYWRSRKREEVLLDSSLREQTLKVVQQVAELFDSHKTPRAIYGKHCESCSLKDLCNPRLTAKDQSKAYVDELYKDRDEETSE